MPPAPPSPPPPAPDIEPAATWAVRSRTHPDPLVRWAYRGLRLGRYLVGLAGRMCLLFVIYTLSIGPMYWRWYSGKFVNGSSLIAAFYEPLWIAAGEYDWFGDWVNSYVQLWHG